MNILFINACPRTHSNTKLLAKYLLSKLPGNVYERNLTKTALSPLTEQIVEQRTGLINKGNFGHPLFALAREFAAADKIVMAAIYVCKSNSRKTTISGIQIIDAALVLEPSCLDKSVGICVIFLAA